MTFNAIAALAALMLVAAFWQAGSAGAQSTPPASFAVAATTVGPMSHAWIVDPTTRQIVHCQAANGAPADCKAMPMPESIRR